MRRPRTAGRWAAIWLALIGRSAVASPPLELVYTAPLECQLAQPGLRPPTVVWKELFDGAQQQIDIEQMYLASQPGEALEPILDSLRRATERGVKLRLLVEAKMERQSAPLLERLRHFPNTEVRVLPFAKVGGGVIHAKLLLVDGKRAFVGSQNFDWRSLSHIHELGLRIEAPELVGQLQATFAWDWAVQPTVAAGQPVTPLNRDRPPAQSEKNAYLVGSPFAFLPPGVGDSESELVRIIGAATRRLQIQLLDYSPLDFRRRRFYPPIDNALRAAAARGIAIELLVSDWNCDQPRIDWLKSLSLVPGVAVRIVTLPEAHRGFIDHARVAHAKYMVIDDALLWLGTSNWEGGYLDTSRNLELVVRDAVLARQAAAVHAQLWRSPYAAPLDVQRQYQHPKIQ